jgi:hypothetical protein
MEVRHAFTSWRWPIVTILLVQRGQHDIEDELIFTNHDGYVFHDSRGLESGSEDELKIVQDFVSRKSQERRLNDRLHVIWFVPLGCLQSRIYGVCFLGTAFRWTMIVHR